MFGFLDSRYGRGCHYHLSNIAIVNKPDDDSKFAEEPKKSEFGTKWGMFGALECSYSGGNRKAISNGENANMHFIENYPRNHDGYGDFDEESHRFQVAENLVGGTVRARETSERNCNKDGMSSTDDRKRKSFIVTRQQIHKSESEHDDFSKFCKSTESRNSQKSAQQSFLCRSNDAESLAHRKPSSSAEVSLNELAISEMLGPVCTPNSEMNMTYAQRKGKAYVDQIFIDRRSIEKPGMRSKCKPFSDALAVLSTNKDLFDEFLPETSFQRERFSEPVLKATYSDSESRYATSSEDGSFNKPFLDTNNHKCQHASKTIVRSNPEKIVILKPASRNVTSPENVTCHCSSVQSYQKMDSRVPNSKPTALSFKEMKRKLKSTFGGNREEPNQISQGGRSHTAANNRSILKVGDCICRGVEIKDTIHSCSNVMVKEKISEKPSLESFDMPDVVFMIEETMRKKIDLPSVNLSKKQESDALFEAKQNLSVSSKNDNELVEHTDRKLSQRTLAQVQSSPEKDFKHIIGREDRPGNEPVNLSHYKYSMNLSESDFLVPNKSQNICSSSSGKESMFSDDYRKDDGVDISEMRSSYNQRTNDQTHCILTPAMDYGNYNGKSKIKEVDSTLQRESCKSDVKIKTTSPVQRRDGIDLHHDDESLIHYVDSHSENETLSSTLDDIPSTPSTPYQSDMADGSKYREHQSPVSILEPYFTDDANSPPSIKFQTAQRSLLPLRLDFEECSFNSSPQFSDITGNLCMNERCQISLYVHSVLQSSHLNWNHLSETTPPCQKILHTSLFNVVEPPHTNPHLDPKLLFDHMNEVLEEIHQCHFCPIWLTSMKPKITSGTLEEIVLHEIMKEADFYLLPQTEKTTLNQTVSKDIANSRSWLDIRLQSEEVVIQVSEDVLEETILDILVETFIDFLKKLELFV